MIMQQALRSAQPCRMQLFSQHHRHAQHLQAQRACRQHTRQQTRAAGGETVRTEKAALPVGPYSQAVKAQGLLWVSGQLGLVPGTKDMAGDGGVEAQAEQALKNMGAVLEAGGSSFDKVVKTTVLLSDMSDFPKVNTVYSKFFSEQPPARSCFAVKTLPMSALVEIEAIASL